MQQALGEAASSAAVRAIRNCSPAERLMLRAVAAEVRFIGSKPSTCEIICTVLSADWTELAPCMRQIFLWPTHNEF